MFTATASSHTATTCAAGNPTADHNTVLKITHAHQLRPVNNGTSPGTIQNGMSISQPMLLI
ncbi:MAG: hypothetical protein Q8M02_14650 [Candidatus Didemnitutus sp.]|nr:hypothetical protein [Candidatus Didemnitutus sp.]